MSHKESQQALSAVLAAAATNIAVGERYRHYKQRDYTVLQVALREEDNEPCVIYRADYGERLIWIRPLSSWLQSVTLADGTEVPRFTKIP